MVMVRGDCDGDVDVDGDGDDYVLATDVEYFLLTIMLFLGRCQHRKFRLKFRPFISKIQRFGTRMTLSIIGSTSSHSTMRIRRPRLAHVRSLSPPNDPRPIS